MERWLPILVPIGLMIIGFIQVVRYMRSNAENMEFAIHFLDKFCLYMNSLGKDQTAFVWILEHSNKMQTLLGEAGVMAYRAPFGMYSTSRYAIILNAIPTIRNEFCRDRIDNRSLIWHGQAVDDCLRRYIGDAKEARQQSDGSVFNPLKLLVEGTRTVLGLAPYILMESGVIGAGGFSSLTRSKGFSVMAGMVTLLSVLATIMSIVLGWRKFLQTIGF